MEWTGTSANNGLGSSSDRGGSGGRGKKQDRKFLCVTCHRTFSRNDILKRHIQLSHSGEENRVLLCGMCTESFKTKRALIEHRAKRHALRSKFKLIAQAHARACELYRLDFPDHVQSMADCLAFVKPKAFELLRYLLHEKKYIKASFVASLRYTKADFLREMTRGGAAGEGVLGYEGDEVITMNHRSPIHKFLLMNGDIEQRMSDMLAHINGIFEDFVHNGSGWVLTDCIAFSVEVGQCKPLAGSAGGCGSHVVNYKRGRILIERDASSSSGGDGHGGDGDEDDMHRCFYRAIRQYFAADKNKMSDEIVENVAVPVAVKDIHKFESANGHLDIAVNVLFLDEDGSLFPTHVSKNINASHQVTLLLFFTKPPRSPPPLDEKSSTATTTTPPASAASALPEMHYALVQDLSRLISTRTKSSSGHSYSQRNHVCFNCLCTFVRRTALQAHVAWCHKEKSQNYVLPDPGSVVKYENAIKEIKIGYVFFFDFETLQVTPEKACACKNLDKCHHKTKNVTEHVAFAYALVMVDRDGNVVEDISYVGADAAAHFLQTVLGLEKKYMKMLKDVAPLEMTEEEKQSHRLATRCHICKQPLEDDIVRDHDHISGKYMGAAHNRCNFLRRECKKLVGFAHNFSGYDSHIVMKAVADYQKHGKGLTYIDAIPLNTEKFKMLKLNRCVLLDSLAFLNASLDQLVETLKVSNHNFPIMHQWSTRIDGGEEKMRLLRSKGVYPYEYVTDMEVVTNTTALPPREAFHSRLSGRHITPEEYAFAKKVWREFDCRSLRDYTDLYCKADTYQLAEAVMELRESIFSEFNIDLCHYLSLPMMTKDIMLKYTRVEIEMMSDIDMIQFVKANIRGGLSYVSTRHFDVDVEREKRGEDVSLLYVDANNLYGAAMRFAMPVSDYQWLTEDELAAFSVDRDVSEDAERGYILEVTLDYPEHLHLDHSAFPLAPEQIEITEKMLSEYAQNVMQQLTKKTKHRSRKLTATFHRRERYVCHGLNLKLYLSLGMNLVTLHRGISFKQVKFLKPYIDMCTAKRAAAKTKTQSNMMKLLCNSLYGKMIESGTNRMDCKFVRDREQALRRNTDPRLRGQLIFSEDLSIAFLAKKQVRLNQSWAVGFSILEISKYIMQSLMYKAIKPTFDGRVGVILSDTDSWILSVPSSSADAAVTELAPVMDFSNYPPAHPLYCDKVKNRTGYLKNETPGKPIKRAVAVCPKTYAYEGEDEGTLKKTADSRLKGVRKAAKRDIPYRAFLRVIEQISEHHVTQYSIMSKGHVNRLVQCRKKAFSSFDDKRHLLCAIHSVPYGSALIEKSKRLNACYFCANPTLFS